MILTLFFEWLLKGIATYNPYYSTEDVLIKGIEEINNQQNTLKKNDVFYKTKVNKDLPLLENIYHVEKIEEFNEFKRFGITSDFSIDNDSLHKMYLELTDKFNWNIFNEQEFFSKRIRESMNKSYSKSFKESMASLIVNISEDNCEAYILCNKLYKKNNKNRKFYKLEFFMKKNDDFVYISFLRWGDVIVDSDKKFLTEIVLDNYDLFFEN